MIKGLKLTHKSLTGVFNHTCNGCGNTNTDVMVSFVKNTELLNGNNQSLAKIEFFDVFMSKEQASNLYKQLGRMLNERS